MDFGSSLLRASSGADSFGRLSEDGFPVDECWGRSDLLVVVVLVSVLGGMKVDVRLCHDSFQAFKESYFDVLGAFWCAARVGRVL